MKQKRYSEEKIFRIFKEAEGSMPVGGSRHCQTGRECCGYAGAVPSAWSLKRGVLGDFLGRHCFPEGCN